MTDNDRFNALHAASNYTSARACLVRPILLLVIALSTLSAGCSGRGVTIPPPGVDRTPPDVRVTIASASHGVQHDFANSDRAVLYPPKGEVTFVVVATDTGATSEGLLLALLLYLFGTKPTAERYISCRLPWLVAGKHFEPKPVIIQATNR